VAIEDNLLLRNTPEFSHINRALRLLGALSTLAFTACASSNDPHQLEIRDRPPSSEVMLTTQVRKDAIDAMLTLLGRHFVDADRVKAQTLAVWRESLVASVSDQDDQTFWQLLDQQLALLCDSHTRLASPIEVRLRESPWSPGIGGIQQSDFIHGNTVNFRAQWLQITRVQAGSVAEQHGVKIGWRLRKINGEDFGEAWARALRSNRCESTQQAAHVRALQRLWQTTGPKWELEFDSVDGSMHHLTLTAATITPQVRYRSANVLEISLPLINHAALDTLQSALKAPADEIILDLRGNRGGSGEIALQIIGLFVNNAPLIARLQTRTGTAIMKGKTTIVPIDLNAAKHGTSDSLYSGPLTVLIDSGTASAAELVAAGLQMLKRARIVGTTSCGCMNPSLGWFNIPGGAQLLISEGRMLLPNGSLIEGQGVTPDASELAVLK
jgi:C-terminal processing protease CtpA/Prc